MKKSVVALISACLPGLSALTGDGAVVLFASGSLQRAFIDNLTHAVVAFFSWLVVAHFTSLDFHLVPRDWMLAALCCLVASSIDLDHFYLAGSLSVQGALHSGDKRGPLHCTSLWLMIAASIFSYSKVMSGHGDMSLDIVDRDLEDEDDVPVTASELLDILKTAWRNEKLSPELLPHKAEVVDAIMEQVEQMEENVKALAVTDHQLLIHRQELERIRYLVRSYLRTRLSKIERHSLWLYRNQTCLSPEEFLFLKEYVTATAAQLKSLADKMPQSVCNLNPHQMETVPDFDTHIVIKSRRDLTEAVLVQDGINEDDVIVAKGSQHIIPYSSIRQHVHSSDIDLI